MATAAIKGQCPVSMMSTDMTRGFNFMFVSLRDVTAHCFL